MNLFRKNLNAVRAVVLIVVWNFLLTILLPIQNVFAQTGPSQSETSGFSLGSTSGMVNKFTGDFNYSIPLMSVEGYPINISYDQNVGMMTEASWVGLGWNLNVGSVSRNMRGLPDDFNGKDKIERVSKRNNLIKDGRKNGGYVSVKALIGPASIGVGGSLMIGDYTNTYNGPGETMDLSFSLNISTGQSLNLGGSSNSVLASLGIKAGIGFSADSQQGVGRSGNFGFSGGLGYGRGHSSFSTSLGLGFGRSFHSRAGKTGMISSFGVGAGYGNPIMNASAGVGGSSYYSYGALTAVPNINSELVTINSSKQTNVNVYGIPVSGTIIADAGYTNIQYEGETQNKTRVTGYKSKQNAFGYFHMGKRNPGGFTDCPECYSEEKSLMDFNSSQAVIYNEEMENLPFSAPTYDLFNISASGIQGQFRAHRSEVGLLKDNSMENVAEGKNKTKEGGVGITGTLPSLLLGGGYQENSSTITVSSNPADGEVNISNNSYAGVDVNNYNAADTNVFLKMNGELTPSNTKMLEDFYGNKPAAMIPSYDASNKELDFAANQMKVKDPNNIPVPSTYSTVNTSSNETEYSASKRIRATDIRMYNAQEAESLDFLTTPRTITENDYYDGSSSVVNRVNDTRNENHISAVDVVNESGIRYIYGTSVYNIKSESVAFSAAGLKDATYNSEGLVKYTSGVDNSIYNDNGKAGFFEKTTTPAYAHSFLLTEMYSHDYVDRFNDGPTQDDIGNYYKFNYTQVYDDNDPYTWRTPVSGENGGDAKANMDIGFRTTEVDDIGRYEYGEKEVWYANSIESKNQVAQFYISDRKDGYAVDEDGFLNYNKTLKKLDSIVLYNKHDLDENGANATPLQTAIFKYDYHLCKNYNKNKNTYQGPQDESGKLTLLEIRIKSGNSDEQALYPYEFQYSTVNKNYSTINIDRWGNYKSNDSSHPNTEYPYVDDSYTNLTESAKNWKLTTITSPTQGKITIAYEPDQYRYVQDKKSMRFMKLQGMTSMIKLTQLNTDDHTSSPQTTLTPYTYNTLRADGNQINDIGNSLDDYDFPGLKDSDRKERRLPNNVLIFKLDHTYSGQSKEELEKLFIKDYFTNDATSGTPKRLDKLYVKTQVKVDPAEDKWENIPTFVNVAKEDVTSFNSLVNSASLPQEIEGINEIGLVGKPGSQGFEYGYVVVALDHINDNQENQDNILKGGDYKVNTIQKSAWQFSRRHLPELVYADCSYNESTEEFNCDYSNNLDWKVVFGGRVNKIFNRKKFCLRFKPNHSFIRTYNNHNQTDKYASSARVKSITYNDNWNTLSGESDATYTWEYSYNGPKNEYEGGVAAYEPMMGNDVNPFYQWSTYQNKKNGSSFPDKVLYNEEPVANILFPAPTIGYEQVSVQFEEVSSPNNMGKSIDRFITAKEYPTIIERTKVFKEGGDHSNLLKTKTSELIGLSQGYVVETNDFHGKNLSSTIKDAGDNLISKTTYDYYDLGEKLPTIDRQGNVQYEELACDYDIYSRRAFSHTKTKSWQIGGSLSTTFFPIFVVPVVNFTKIENESGIYTSIFHKAIHRKAIVKSVRTQYLDSDNYAENNYYDRYTGNVLVSSLRDEYDDKLYSVNYPAHWYYENFQNRHRATPYEFTSTNNVTVVDGVISNTSSSMLTALSEGDILFCDDGSTISEAIVVDKSSSSISLIEPVTGDNFTTGTVVFDNIKIHYPGRKNRLTAMMQNVTTKDDSFLDNGFDFPSDYIISVNAVSFKENSNVYCDGGELSPLYRVPISPGDNIDPFHHGVKGIYRIANSFAFQQSRDQNDPHNTRHSGTLENYVSFYELVNGEWNKITDPNHSNYTSISDYGDYRMLGDLTEHDEFGKPVESQNQIDVFSSSLYGYSNSLKVIPVAQASNARQSEIAYDGFEDYNYLLNNSSSGHFDFTKAINTSSVSLSANERHSGRYSLSVPYNEEPTVVRDIDNTDPCGQETGHMKEGQYEVLNCDCVEDFSPTPGKYVISLWVKEQEPDDPTDYNQTSVRVESVDGSTILQSDTFDPSGPVLDGWQRIEGIFTIPSNAATIEVTIDANNGAYADDIRIHPFKSSMVTMVYDKYTLLPLAKHDAYNFTTFYNYDRNLQVRKVRVETVEGIKTVTESESGGKKTFVTN